MILLCGFRNGDYFGAQLNVPDKKIFSPPIKSKLDAPSILSYSCYYSHTVFVTREGRIYAIGNNYKSIISSTLRKEPYYDFTEIALCVKGQFYHPISVLCGHNFTLYLVIDPHNKKLNKVDLRFGASIVS